MNRNSEDFNIKEVKEEEDCDTPHIKQGSVQDFHLPITVSGVPQIARANSDEYVSLKEIEQRETKQKRGKLLQPMSHGHQPTKLKHDPLHDIIEKIDKTGFIPASSTILKLDLFGSRHSKNSKNHQSDIDDKDDETQSLLMKTIFKQIFGTKLKKVTKFEFAHLNRQNQLQIKAQKFQLGQFFKSLVYWLLTLLFLGPLADIYNRCRGVGKDKKSGKFRILISMLLHTAYAMNGYIIWLQLFDLIEFREHMIHNQFIIAFIIVWSFFYAMQDGFFLLEKRYNNLRFQSMIESPVVKNAIKQHYKLGSVGKEDKISHRFMRNYKNLIKNFENNDIHYSIVDDIKTDTQLNYLILNLRIDPLIDQLQFMGDQPLSESVKKRIREQNCSEDINRIYQQYTESFDFHLSLNLSFIKYKEFQEKGYYQIKDVAKYLINYYVNNCYCGVSTRNIFDGTRMICILLLTLYHIIRLVNNIRIDDQSWLALCLEEGNALSIHILVYGIVKCFLKGILILKTKIDCIYQVSELIAYYGVKKTKSCLTQNKILPTIKYIDIYSLKSVGDLRKIFFKHWGKETMNMQVILSILVIVAIAQTIIMIFFTDVSLVKEVVVSFDSEQLQLFITAVVLSIIVLIVSYYSAKINFFFEHTRRLLTKIILQLRDIRRFAKDYLGKGRITSQVLEIALCVNELKEQVRQKEKGLSNEEYLEMEKETLDEMIGMLENQFEKLDYEEEHYSFNILGLFPITFNMLIGLVVTLGTSIAVMFGQYLYEHVFGE